MCTREKDIFLSHLCKKKVTLVTSPYLLYNISFLNTKYFQTDNINKQYLHSEYGPSMGNKLALYSNLSLSKWRTVCFLFLCNRRENPQRSNMSPLRFLMTDTRTQGREIHINKKIMMRHEQRPAELVQVCVQTTVFYIWCLVWFQWRCIDWDQSCWSTRTSVTASSSLF